MIFVFASAAPHMVSLGRKNLNFYFCNYEQSGLKRSDGSDCREAK